MQEKRVYTNEKWQRVVFIGEEKFNLDGSVNLHYYRHDLRKGQQRLVRRPIADCGIVIGEVLVTKVRWK